MIWIILIAIGLLMWGSENNQRSGPNNNWTDYLE
jgi:hypothetical protein